MLFAVVSNVSVCNGRRTCPRPAFPKTTLTISVYTQAHMDVYSGLIRKGVPIQMVVIEEGNRPMPVHPVFVTLLNLITIHCAFLITIDGASLMYMLMVSILFWMREEGGISP